MSDHNVLLLVICGVAFWAGIKVGKILCDRFL